MNLQDIKNEIKYTLLELSEAVISSHKDSLMKKLEALYQLEIIFKDN